MCSLARPAVLQAAIDEPALFSGVQVINISLRMLHTSKQAPWQRPMVKALQVGWAHTSPHMDLSGVHWEAEWWLVPRKAGIGGAVILMGVPCSQHGCPAGCAPWGPGLTTW